MNSVRTLFLASLTIIARVLAQGSDVTQCIPQYQWSINTRGQTPCLVAAFLESSCSGTPHDVNQVPPGHHYIGPISTEADLCACNSVTYSLVEACGLCQGQTQLISYSDWTLNCRTTLQIGQFPKTIPDVIELPSWASLNISLTNNTFDPLAAEREAEKANLPLSHSSTTTNTPMSTQTQLPPPSAPPLPVSSGSAALSNDSGGLSSGAIAGITIGALAFILVILLFIFWRMLRARRQRNSKPMPLDEPFSPVTDKPNPASFPFHQHAHSRSLSDPASIITPYIYSASEPDRQPVSPGASTYYTTAPVRDSVDEMTSPQSAISPRTIMTAQSPKTPTGPHGYTGAPEV